ncbi:MAG: hypothetical protein N2746_06035 [Deltaproteobacteria bacterium]|nr:hypothetical protein [Deltaproteobacteria bacterium]
MKNMKALNVLWIFFFVLINALCVGCSCSEEGTGVVVEDVRDSDDIVDIGNKDVGFTDPCDGQNCSGHGKCAVIDGKTPICICDVGYHQAGGGLECEKDDVTDPCKGVDCNVGGVCAVSGGKPICVCGPGYYNAGPTTCKEMENNLCATVSCSGHGRCRVVSGGRTVICDCDDGYHAEGLSCIENDSSNPCKGVDCNEHGYCITVSTGKLPACVCDLNYYPVGQTNCIFDPQLTEVSSDFCVPSLSNPPGIVKIGDDVSISSLKWAGNNVIVIYGRPSTNTIWAQAVFSNGSKIGELEIHTGQWEVRHARASGERVAIIPALPGYNQPAANTVYLIDSKASSLNKVEIAFGPSIFVDLPDGGGFVAFKDNKIQHISVNGNVSSTIDIKENLPIISIVGLKSNLLAVALKGNDSSIMIRLLSLDGTFLTNGVPLHVPNKCTHHDRNVFMTLGDNFFLASHVCEAGYDGWYCYVTFFEHDGSMKMAPLPVAPKGYCAFGVPLQFVWTGRYLIENRNGRLYDRNGIYSGKDLMIKADGFICSGPSPEKDGRIALICKNEQNQKQGGIAFANCQ